MTRDDASLWSRAKDVLHRLLELPEAERLGAVERECAGDTALRAEVMSLLAASAPERDVLTRIGHALDEGLPVRRSPPRWLGEEIGGFIVREPIGRGGMGFVYRGVSPTGDRTVAIKLLDRRFALASSLERFDLERAGLDRLDHPGIARLLATGTTPDGDPYYIMEYVEGRPIDEHADERRAGTRERIRILLRVCPAISHAHERGVIHRDLKPSNILVRPSGDPCLLDFGIAKLLDPEEGGQPSDLSIEAPAFTPFYASPEHLDGDPVSPASDVYSLGALAYRLLSGSHPRMKAPREPYSLAETFMALGPKGRAVAAAGRGVTPAALLAELGDPLESVILRACHARPESRQQSVEAFAEELRECIA